MALRPILIIGHPTLAEKALPIEAVDDDVRRLADDMIETMHAKPGIGLAAPQVDVGRRLIVVDLSVGKDPEALYILVNPEIAESEGNCLSEEGCLSVPEIYEDVERPERVVVTGLDLEGRPVRIEARDLLARAFCHEIDHLDGKLFVDLLSSLKRSLIKRKFRKAAAKESLP